jgi:hypothetical protein
MSAQVSILAKLDDQCYLRGLDNNSMEPTDIRMIQDLGLGLRFEIKLRLRPRLRLEIKGWG